MGDSAAQQVSGLWVNQFGSLLEIECDGAGHVTGTFESGVGGGSGRHEVIGFVDPTPSTVTVPVGLVVTWRPAHSVTVWSGHYRSDEDTIAATWLLAGEPADHQDWHATTVGHDLFHRVVARRTPQEAAAEAERAEAEAVTLTF